MSLWPCKRRHGWDLRVCVTCVENIHPDKAEVFERIKKEECCLLYTSYKKVRGKRGNEMELITRAPKGTVDLVPGVSEKWKLVEGVFESEAELNGCLLYTSGSAVPESDKWGRLESFRSERVSKKQAGMKVSKKTLGRFFDPKGSAKSRPE